MNFDFSKRKIDKGRARKPKTGNNPDSNVGPACYPELTDQVIAYLFGLRAHIMAQFVE